MMGGLLYERQSAATTTTKTDSSSAATATAANTGSSTPKELIPLPSAPPATISRSPASLSRRICSMDREEGQEDDYIYSEQHVSIANSRYQYVDTPSSFIGHGSYGTVFKGLDSIRNEVVAIKKMSRLNVKPSELAVMKRVRDHHLVALLDVVNEGEDLTYLIMELCDNDLDRHLRWTAPEGRLGDAELHTVVASIACGYYALCLKQIVHRDIKPQNILLLYDPSSGAISMAKLTDFGVSRVLTDEDEEGGGGDQLLCNVAGTLPYMAPEVGANLVSVCEYDYSVDVWAIGCVIYQCHTGKVPFDERALCRLFLHCAGGNYAAYDPPELPASTPRKLRMLIGSLLEIDRHKRATPKQLYDALVGSSPLLKDHHQHQQRGK